MKIKTALSIFILLLLTLFGALSFSLIKATDLLKLEAESLSHSAERVRLAEEIKGHLVLYNRNKFLYSINQDPRRLQSTIEHRAALVTLLDGSGQLANDKDAELEFGGLKEKVTDYLKAIDRMGEAEGLSPIKKYLQVSSKVDAIIDVNDRLINLEILKSRNTLLNIDRWNKYADRSSVLLFSFAGFTLFGLLLAVIFKVYRPLASLVDVISRSARGNGFVPAPVYGLKEIQDLSTKFNLMSERLAETRNDQLSFIASIAHDLRNPLNSMSMAAQLLLRNGEVAGRDVPSIIVRQVKNLDRIVGDLLDTTRIEAGQLDIELSNQDVGPILRDAVELHRTTSGLHNFKLEMPNRLLACKCDRGRLSQVMNNLFSNAIKYSPNGGTVTVKVWEEKHQTFISVADHGIGIDPQDLDSIFKPFHRAKATKNTIPGIGLGLSASRKILEAHGGNLSVESILGKGSTFFVSIPSQAKASQTFKWIEGHGPSPAI